MKKLFRTRNSSIAGVCSGISKYFNIDETVIRILFIVGIFTPVPTIFIYLLMWIIIPKEPIQYE
jgi:phage shock protein C